MTTVVIVTNPDRIENVVRDVKTPATVRLVNSAGVKRSALVYTSDELKRVLHSAFQVAGSTDQVQVERRR